MTSIVKQVGHNSHLISYAFVFFGVLTAVVNRELAEQKNNRLYSTACIFCSRFQFFNDGKPGHHARDCDSNNKPKKTIIYYLYNDVNLY